MEILETFGEGLGCGSTKEGASTPEGPLQVSNKGAAERSGQRRANHLAMWPEV
jgi:hypothetical protein